MDLFVLAASPSLAIFGSSDFGQGQETVGLLSCGPGTILIFHFSMQEKAARQQMQNRASTSALLRLRRAPRLAI